MRWIAAAMAACTGSGPGERSVRGEPDYLAEVYLSGATDSEIQGGAGVAFTPYEPHDAGESPFPALDTCEPDTTTTTTITPTTTPTIPTASPGDFTVTLDGSPLAFIVEGTILEGGIAHIAEWPDGAELGLSITGDEVPAFDVPDLMTLPSAPQAEVTSDGEGSLEIAWDPDESDTLLLILLTKDGDDTVTCTVEDDGAFTVPAADLPGPADTIFGSLDRFLSRDTTAADGRVEVFGWTNISGDIFGL